MIRLNLKLYKAGLCSYYFKVHKLVTQNIITNLGFQLLVCQVEIHFFLPNQN